MQGQWNGGSNGPNYGNNYGGNPWTGRNGAWGGNWNGAFCVDGQPDTNGPCIRQQDFQQNYRDTLLSLQQLQQQMRDDPSTARDIQGVIRDLRQFDPFTGSNDPLLNERIQAALAGVEQVEMELRRKVDETSGNGSIRSPGGEKVPQGWEEAAAEYFRKLSKSK